MSTLKLIIQTIKVNCREPINTSDTCIKVSQETNYPDGIFLNLFYRNLTEIFSDLSSYKNKANEEISTILSESKLPEYFTPFCKILELIKFKNLSRILNLNKLAKELQSEQVLHNLGK